MSSWQGDQTHLCQKEKEQSHLSISPEHKVGESQGEQELHLGKRGIRAGAWGGKEGFYHKGRQVPRKKERVSKENLPRRSKRKYDQVGGCKSSPEGSTVP